MLRVGVIGSRTFDDYELLKSKLDEYHISEIVSGGAMGADRLAEIYSKKELGKNPIIFRPNYEKYGRGAPLMRNTTIVENSDIIVAFWDGESRGTKDTIDKATAMGKQVYIVSFQ